MLLKWQENRPDSSTERRATEQTAPAFGPASQARPSFLYSTQWCADTSHPEQSTFPRALRNSTQIRGRQEDSLLTPKSSWCNSPFLSLSCSGGNPLLTLLQNPAPQPKNPSPYVIGFLISLFPKPHTASHTSSVPNFLLFSFSYNYFTDEALLTSFTAPFSSFLSPSLSTFHLKTLTPTFSKFLTEVLQGWP